ncbi:hypothetical protein BH11ARM1_BH11ARM1_08600 [soil metagenome]
MSAMGSVRGKLFVVDRPPDYCPDPRDSVYLLGTLSSFESGVNVRFWTFTQLLVGTVVGAGATIAAVATVAVGGFWGRNRLGEFVRNATLSG